MDINRGPNATAEGEFTDGDAQLGVPRSLLASKFMNMLLREGKNLVEKAGLALDELDEEQWYKAILAIRDENLFVNAGNPAFGATGDGVTDDTAAVQAAIDSIVSEQGFVIIPRNVPYIYADLVVPVGIYIFDIAAGRVLLSDVAYEKGVFNDQVIFRNAKADTPTRVYIMPRGAVPAGAVAAFKLFATDYTANQADYADFGLYYDVTDDVFRINSKNNGATSNKPMEVTFQDGSRTACTFFQGDDGGSLYAGIVFGGRLVDVDALTKFSIVPLIFAQSAAFANGKALRWYLSLIHI